MGLTERHLFENEEPELTDQQLEEMVYENKKAYTNGYSVEEAIDAWDTRQEGR